MADQLFSWFSNGSSLTPTMLQDQADTFRVTGSLSSWCLFLVCALQPLTTILADFAAGNGLSGPAIAGIAAGIPCSLLFLLLLGLLIYFIVYHRKKKRLCFVLFFSCVLLVKNCPNADSNDLLMFFVPVHLYVSGQQARYPVQRAVEKVWTSSTLSVILMRLWV